MRTIVTDKGLKQLVKKVVKAEKVEGTLFFNDYEHFKDKIDMILENTDVQKVSHKKILNILGELNITVELPEDFEVQK